MKNYVVYVVNAMYCIIVGQGQVGHDYLIISMFCSFPVPSAYEGLLSIVVWNPYVWLKTWNAFSHAEILCKSGTSLWNYWELAQNGASTVVLKLSCDKVVNL